MTRPLEPPNFAPGDRVVLSARGPGRITGRRRRAEGRGPVDYLVFTPDDGGMNVLVPARSAAQAGLRPVLGADAAQRVLDDLRAPPVAIDGPPEAWRLERWRSGRPEDLVALLRHLWSDPPDALSGGLGVERVRGRLAAELSASTGETPSAWSARISAALAGGDAP